MTIIIGIFYSIGNNISQFNSNHLNKSKKKENS